MQNLQDKKKIQMQIPTDSSVAEITETQWPLCLMDWHNTTRNGRADFQLWQFLSENVFNQASPLNTQ